MLSGYQVVLHALEELCVTAELCPRLPVGIEVIAISNSYESARFIWNIFLLLVYWGSICV